MDSYKLFIHKYCGHLRYFDFGSPTSILYRQKKRESHKNVYRYICDISNFDVDIFRRLLRAVDWDVIYATDDVEMMWTYFYDKVFDILSVMCPLKRFKQREFVTPWLNAEIYQMMRKRDRYIRLFRSTGNSCYLQWALLSRNIVNSKIAKAKSSYIKNQLRSIQKNPKKFWRIIQNIIAPKYDILPGQRFFDVKTNNFVNVGDEPDFLNSFFADIVANLEIPQSDNLCENVYDVHNVFCFTNDMPTVLEITKLIAEIDVNKSSCVRDINAKFCKEAMLSVPNFICNICTKSLSSGVIPKEWVEGTITLIPKDGDLTLPGNWRPITQTSIFAKILEKLVHSRLLKHFVELHILSDYQFGFLPGRSTQLAIFELSKQIYSAMNNKKIFGASCYPMV